MHFLLSFQQTLAELNKNYEIVKLITQSLSKCHDLAVKISQNKPPQPNVLIDGKYSLMEVTVL